MKAVSTSKRIHIIMILLVFCGLSGLVAQNVEMEITAAAGPATEVSGEDLEDASRAEKLAKSISAVDSLNKSFATIEITVKYDKGEEPYPRGYIPRISGSLEDYVKEERPVEIAAYVLSENMFIAPNLNANERFVEKIEVRYGDQIVAAEPQRYFENQYAVIYKTAEPLKGATPLKFDTAAEGPYSVIYRAYAGGAWRTHVEALPSNVVVTDVWEPRTSVQPYGLVITADGEPVGMSMNGELPADDSWKGSPMDWKGPSASALGALLETTQQRASASICRVTLELRSPKKKAGAAYSSLGGDDSDETEIQAVGVILDSGQVLVLQSLKPKVTARLERIRVHVPQAEPVMATFQHTLKDYGCFIATLDAPIDSGITLSTKDIRESVDMLLPGFEAMVRGEELVTYTQHMRIPRCEVGWRRHIYPSLFGPAWNAFLFDTSGNLLALPVSQRQKIATQNRYSRDDYPRLTAAVYLAEALANLEDNIAPDNVPLSEDEEGRLAWLGVELQPLNEELARANDVSDLTRNGRVGALVTYVYPDSPADQKGIEQGDILLRLFVKDQPKPIDIEYEDGGYYSRGPFPWERLSEVPDQYFDQIPRPWPPAENSLTRVLTDLGFGKEFDLQIFRNGETQKIPFQTVQSPRHFDTAEKFKSDDLGITVKNMTYELQRFYRRTAEDQGVIIAVIEPGSKASVAGLHPYELITHVNDKPVDNVATFEKLLEDGGEMRFSIKRWTKGRVVKMEMETTEDPDAPASQPASDAKGTDTEDADAPTTDTQPADAVEDATDEIRQPVPADASAD